MTNIIQIKKLYWSWIISIHITLGSLYSTFEPEEARRIAERLEIHHTPKHASWMNQIEIWFGILMKKVVKRGNFKSKQNLKMKLNNFIDYFNTTMAKPFKWTYRGKLLEV
ncbi:transposase [Candidatus Halobeggiatoa sp. HSG11]|nr:transposase [Candidatus Halobeggiatoa sp. HSG11]